MRNSSLGDFSTAVSERERMGSSTVIPALVRNDSMSFPSWPGPPPE